MMRAIVVDGEFVVDEPLNTQSVRAGSCKHRREPGTILTHVKTFHGYNAEGKVLERFVRTYETEFSRRPAFEA